MNDPHENATWVYNYDRGDNILSKVKYAYTTGTLGTAVETIPYAYSDSNWKDKLTAYNGTAITYDAIGNPLNDGNWTYEWTVGRQLKKMSKPGKEIEFKYDFNGLRTQKIITENGVTTTTNYLLHGKLVTHMTIGNDKLHFFYDNSSRPAKVDFNGTIYTYLHNLQGDIVGILDNAGNLVVEYKYDAWGKPLSTTGSLAGTLGIRNPFRYRGYVYDEETGVYYLRSRYYNPAVGRFTNADGLVGRRGDILSHNIYCYCDNKPILCVDLTGAGKTYVFYYYFPESTGSLKEEAMNSPYFDAADEDAVSMIPIKTAEDFINAWNAMEGEIDEVYLYLHGAAGHFLLANGRIGFDDVSEYSIDDLNEKIINGTLYDFACYGAAKKGGKTVAGVLSEKTQATVIACDVGVSYRFEQDWLGWYFGNTYHARTRTMSLYQPHWFRFTYNKKKQNVRKMKLHIWRVAKGLIY